MHLILTGATGLVGSGVLQHMLVTKAVTKVSILSRKPVAQAENNPKVDVIIHKDFKQYSEALEKLKGADGCIWALGISQNSVTKEEYKEITFDYTMAAAKAFSTLKDPFTFVFVSGEGATLTPGRFTPIFGVVKGQTEQALLELSKTTPSFKPYSLRPGGVNPSAQPEIHPFLAQNTRMAIMRNVLIPVLQATVPARFMSPTADLSRVLVELAMSGGKPLDGEGISAEGRTISNVGMRRLAGI